MEKLIDLGTIYNLKGGSLKALCADFPYDFSCEWKRPAVIIVPGGAYETVSEREGSPVALQFLARGFQTFILKYLTKTDGVYYPEELTELAAAVDYVKKHAAEFYVDADEIFVVGFSAGGHLVANLAVDYKNIKNYNCKPVGVGLCYPVITTKAGYSYTHENILNCHSDEERNELLKVLNLDEVVDCETAPCFIWTTADDDVVPSENSLRFALALAKNGVPYELHVYPFGHHGTASCDEEINFGDGTFKRYAKWIDDCAAFFRNYIKEKF